MALATVRAPEVILRPFFVAPAMAVSAGVAIARPVRVTPVAVTLLFRSRLMPVILAPAVKVRAVPLALMCKARYKPAAIFPKST